MERNGRRPAPWQDQEGQPARTTVLSAAGCLTALPFLPPGHTSQVAWGFHAPSDGRLYEFYRAYRPPREMNGLNPVARLDEGLSYWLTISEEAPAGRLVCRWLLYRQARALAGRRLGFARFSSPLLMRDELPALLMRAGGTATTGPVGLTGLVEDTLPG